MPIYEYMCQSCGKHHEAMQKFSDPPLAVCPSCGGELKKLISSTSFVLKGSGWYADGYASSPTKNGGPAGDTEKKADTPAAATPSAPSATSSSSGEKKEKPSGSGNGNGSGAKASSDS